MEFNTKTSTYKLATQKDVNKIKKTTIHKMMTQIIGIEDFEDVVIKNKPIMGILRTLTGYSMVLRVSSADPYLLSDADFTSFENTLLSLTYGLDFDLKLERSTRNQNFKKYMEFIDLTSKKVKCSDYLLKYKENLFKEFKNMEKQTGASVKSNYIIVYSDDPNRAVAKKELLDRANYLLRVLQDSNFRLSVVGNMDLIQYVFNKFHMGEYVDLEKFIESDAFNIVVEKVGENIVPFETISDEFIELKISEEEEKKAKEELELREKLSPKEYKKYQKKIKKEQANYEKKHKKELEEFNILSTSYTEIIKPDVFMEKSDYIQLGSTSYVRCLAVTTLPSSINVFTLNSLNNIENMEINISLQKLNDARMSKVLRNESNKIISNIHLKEKQTGALEHAQRKMAANIEGLIEAIETNSDKLFSAQIIIKLWSNNLIELENMTKTVKENFEKTAMNLRVLFKDQKNAFMTTLPTPVIAYKESKKNFTAGAASCLIPNGCTHLRHSEGRFIGRSLITNFPIILDHFICQKPDQPESEMYSNSNVYIVGKSGSGKSSFLKLQIARSLLIGDVHVIFDPHGEYKKMIDKLGGKYVYLRNGIKTGINPLEIKVIIDDITKEKTVPVNEKIAEITALINNFIATYRKDNVGLVGAEITTVTEAVRAIYEERGITSDPESLFEINDNGEKVKKNLPTLSDLKLELERNKEKLPEVAEMMKIITGDGIMSLFDCQTDDEIAHMLDTRLVCFSLKELDDVTKTYAMTTLLNWLWAMFSAWELAGIQKNIDIDEGWLLSKHKQSLEILENYSRSGRKYMISLTIASQSIQEFLGTSEGKAILDACSFKYIFRQDAKLSNEIGEYFGLSDSAKNKLPNFQKGQCIIATEIGNLMAQVDLFDSEKDFATTSGGMNNEK
ncbi:ATP-binding protein [Clostridium perfringens]|uniref:VirB4 family type IV secretion system protein n=1 Tax=Clostridium perfringens TaxID=1502 RepID=UPI001C85E461|nr:ATP-binding protein [Clostridium perfringens]MDU7141857.1 ATP-binding protein [Anaerococcus vaginalis]MDU7977710.1 ATP-binding protein [Clostridioides difficile]MDN4737973.1 ATP-binding protein [Clostridium perfringens]MDN4741282.1 ATP-binding protein [Clostridium perfringens]MDU3774704.1 ATP-binding protein [Clostridium perfringens]